MLSMAAAFKDPLARIARGDVELRSLFVQKLAPWIILAVQNGKIVAVKGSDGKYRLKVVEAT